MTKKKAPMEKDVLKSSFPSEEESLVARFFKKLAESGKMFIIQNRSHTGQYSGNEVDHSLPIHEPENIRVNGAWAGFTFGGIFYRTDLITHKEAFMAWLKEKLDAAKDFFWADQNPCTCPKHIHFFSSVAPN